MGDGCPHQEASCHQNQAEQGKKSISVGNAKSGSKDAADGEKAYVPTCHKQGKSHDIKSG